MPAVHPAADQAVAEADRGRDLLEKDLPAVAGRVSGEDHAEVGKQLRLVVLPVVAALSANVPEAQRLAELYLPDAGPLSEAQVREAADLVERAGGRDWAEREAKRQRDEALAALAAADPDAEGARVLTSLAQVVTHRSW